MPSAAHAALVSDPDDEPRLADWMIAYQAGDLEAFHHLFAALAPALHRHFTAQRFPSGLADDLVQETFLALHRGRRTYSPPLPVRPWIFGIARNVERHQRRRTVRKEGREVSDALADGDTQDRPDPLALRDLRRALGALPPSRRQVWVLHHVHGFSFPEIAARLRIGLDAAKLRSSRAMTALRAALHGSGKEDG